MIVTRNFRTGPTRRCDAAVMLLRDFLGSRYGGGFALALAEALFGICLRPRSLLEKPLPVVAASNRLVKDAQEDAARAQLGFGNWVVAAAVVC